MRKDKNSLLFPLLLAIVAILFLALRLYDFARPASKDEVTWVWPALNHVGPKVFNLHPPAGILSYTLASDILGWRNLRLFPILFSFLAFLGMLFLATRVGGKRAAVLAGFLSAVSYYSVIASQTIDVDGGIVTALYVFAFIVFLKFADSDFSDWRFGLLFGCLVALSSLFRIVFFATFLPFLAYPILRRNFRAQSLLPFLLVPLFLLAWAAWDYSATGGEGVRETLLHAGGGTLSQLANPGAALIDKARFLYIVQRKITPPFLALAILALASLVLRRKNAKKPSPERATLGTLAISVLFVFAFYTIPFGGDKPRYLTLALPFLFILVANFLSGIPVRKAHLPICLLAFLVSLSLLLGFSLTEWETTGNFLAFTILKIGISLLPSLLAFLFLGRRDSLPLVSALLLSAFLAFSLYYTFVASTEKDSSRIVSDLKGLDKPTLVFGEYGLPFHLQTAGIFSGALSEAPSNSSLLIASGEYFRYLKARGIRQIVQFPETVFPREDLGRIMRENSISYLVVSKKIIVGSEIGIPDSCQETRRIERNGEIQARVYSCLIS